MFCKKSPDSIGFIEYNDPEKTLPKYKRWTLTSANCYRRGCRCGGIENLSECEMLQYCAAPHAQFIIKQVVIKLVKELGIQRIEDDLQKQIKESDYDTSFDS